MPIGLVFGNVGLSAWHRKEQARQRQQWLKKISRRK